jgi:hypothetical protein
LLDRERRERMAVMKDGGNERSTPEISRNGWG